MCFQLTQVRVAFVGDDNDCRIVIMVLGVGESSVFEVFYRTGDVVESLPWRCPCSAVCSRLECSVGYLMSEQGDGRNSGDS